MHTNVKIKTLLKIGRDVIGHGCTYSEKSWDKPDKPSKKWRTTYIDVRDSTEKAKELRITLLQANLKEVTVTIGWFGDTVTLLYPITWRK